MKFNLKDSVLDEKAKEEFSTNVEQFTDIFSLRDEIGTCPFIEVHLKLKDETPFFVRQYPMREEQKKVIQKEMDRLEHLGIIQKGLTGYSSPVVLVKWKNQNLYQACSDFCILNEKLVKINHAFPLVRDCIEQLGKTPSMYNYEPSYNIRPANLPDPHKTKLTAETVDDTAQVRERRGFGSILAKAIPGLITLAIESVVHTSRLALSSQKYCGIKPYY